VDYFLADEYVGAKRKHPLNEKMATSVKEVQKLTAHVKVTTGNAGGPFAGKSKKAKGGGYWKQPVKQGGSLPPGFDKPKPAAGAHMGSDMPPILCFKCKELGHVAAMCPNK
jgi:hypothetical protein